MSVVINGTGSISGLSNVGGISSAQSGSVIQTVYVSYSTQFATTSGSYASSGIAASITPQFSNSKILILMSIPALVQHTSNNDNGIGLSIYRGGVQTYTDANTYDSLYANTNGSAYPVLRGRVFLGYLDSPATTSSTTYTLYTAAYGGTATTCSNGAIATVTLLEIAA